MATEGWQDALWRSFDARKWCRLRLASKEEELGSFVGKESMCHENARAFVEANPDYIVAQGWLVATWVPLGILIKHSVVRSRSGELLDVTQQQSTFLSCFLPHPDTADSEPYQCLPNELRQWLTPSPA